MPFAKGRSKTGGRKKGGSFAATVKETMMRLGCNPAEGLADLALNSENESIRLRANAELLEYIYPKLRSMELSGDKANPVEVNVSYREQLLSRIASLAPGKPKG